MPLAPELDLNFFDVNTYVGQSESSGASVH